MKLVSVFMFILAIIGCSKSYDPNDPKQFMDSFISKVSAGDYDKASLHLQKEVREYVNSMAADGEKTKKEFFFEYKNMEFHEMDSDNNKENMGLWYKSDKYEALFKLKKIDGKWFIYDVDTF